MADQMKWEKVVLDLGKVPTGNSRLEQWEMAMVGNHELVSPPGVQGIVAS